MGYHQPQNTRTDVYTPAHTHTHSDTNLVGSPVFGRMKPGSPKKKDNEAIFHYFPSGF